MSAIFEKAVRKSIEGAVVDALNRVNLMNEITASSPRAVGDAVQSYLETHFIHCIPADLVRDFNASFARRAMADFAFSDIDGNYYIVDNKTHNINTAFNMPNLTSVERLARFYEDFTNYFTVLLVSYTVVDHLLSFEQCTFVPIEFLDWSCLTLGALGWGQIQIANSNRIIINERCTRKDWMLTLCDRLDEFYPKEIAKITGRIEHFQKVRSFWERQ